MIPGTLLCGYLGCDAHATVEVSTAYDKPVPRCDEHYPVTLAAYSQFANRNGDGARLRALEGEVTW